MTTVVAGAYTLTGFSAAFETGGYDPSYTGAKFLIDRSNNDDFGSGSYDFNFQSSGLSGPQVIQATSSSADQWSLKVTISSSVAAPMSSFDDISYGNFTEFADADGNDQHSLTFAGTGATNLTAVLQGLLITTGNQTGDVLGVTFDLVDGSGAFTGTSGAAESVSTSYFAASPACYTAGTRIAVPAGETPVEALRAGDLVLTANGAASPVKWIGRRSYSAAQLRGNAQLRPVVIRSGALAENVPHRDLSVSPMHGMHIDGVFIPAAALVNGTTILRSQATTPLEYLHVELDRHCVLLANGAAAESYADDDSRLMFDNADEYTDRFGAGTRVGFSAPRLEQGHDLEAIRHRLLIRAGLSPHPATSGPMRGHVERMVDDTIEGWVLDESGPAPVELEIWADGAVVATGLANRYRADLDHAGLAGGRCAFSIDMPADTDIERVEIRRRQDGAALAMPRVSVAAA